VSSAPIQLDFALAPRDPGALQSTLSSLYNPASPLYHHFLSPGAFGATFGASPATIATVTTQLEAIGLHPGPVNADGLIIPVSTTVGAAGRALGVSIHDYRLADGRVAYANLNAPRVPSSIAPAITAIVGLSDIARPKTQLLAPPLTEHARQASADSRTTIGAYLTSATSATSPACSGAQSSGGYTAGQLASAYGFDSGPYRNGLFGQGETIALYELEPFSSTDVGTFESCYGIHTTVRKVAVDGGAGTGTGSGESILDIDTAIELAPDATVDVYEAPNNGGSGPLDEYAQIANDDTAEVVSTSWGICEASLGASAAQAEEAIFMQMALQGQSVFAAAGDTGSEDCYLGPGSSTALAVDDPGSDPYVTSVGGTTLSLSPNETRASETVWNDRSTQGGSGGGGISSLWRMPAWQSGQGVVETFSTNATCGAPSGSYCREVPDVSAVADPYDGFGIYLANQWMSVGGTSGATPLWAAVVTLADQSCAATSPADASGLVNPALYSHAGDLFDVTSGDNDYTGNNNGAYPAGAGYDMASGLGSPTAAVFKPGVLCQARGATVASTSSPPAAPTVSPSAPTTPTGHGYWLIGSDGGVFSFGDAAFEGSVPADNIHINNIIAAIPSF
jgi:subtilase family serine protease